MQKPFDVSSVVFISDSRALKSSLVFAHGQLYSYFTNKDMTIYFY